MFFKFQDVQRSRLPRCGGFAASLPSTLGTFPTGAVGDLGKLKVKPVIFLVLSLLLGIPGFWFTLEGLDWDRLGHVTMQNCTANRNDCSL